ncbi:MAG: hypothetical protein WC570_02950 [Patescibacteria group bacterium]
MKIYRYDRWRFGILIGITLLLFIIYGVENGWTVTMMSNQIVLSKVIADSNMLYKNNYSKITGGDDCAWSNVLADFPFVQDDTLVGLGRYDQEKEGYFGDYLSQEAFEVFLPNYFGQATFFSKNGAALFISPVGFEEANSKPKLCQQRLVYDEIYPSTLYVRMFNDGGIKDYIILKDASAPTTISFDLNYYGGRVELAPTGDIVFYGDDGSEKFKIDRMMGYDSEHRIIDDSISYQLLDSQTLILNIAPGDINYPVLLE